MIEKIVFWNADTQRFCSSPAKIYLLYLIYSLQISFMYVFISAPTPFLHLISHL